MATRPSGRESISTDSRKAKRKETMRDYDENLDKLRKNSDAFEADLKRYLCGKAKEVRDLRSALAEKEVTIQEIRVELQRLEEIIRQQDETIKELRHQLCSQREKQKGRFGILTDSGKAKRKETMTDDDLVELRKKGDAFEAELKRNLLGIEKEVRELRSTLEGKEETTQYMRGQMQRLDEIIRQQNETIKDLRHQLCSPRSP